MALPVNPVGGGEEVGDVLFPLGHHHIAAPFAHHAHILHPGIPDQRIGWAAGPVEAIGTAGISQQARRVGGAVVAGVPEVPPPPLAHDPATLAEIAVPCLCTTAGKERHARRRAKLDQFARKGERAGSWLVRLQRSRCPANGQPPQGGPDSGRHHQRGPGWLFTPPASRCCMPESERNHGLIIPRLRLTPHPCRPPRGTGGRPLLSFGESTA